MPFSWAVVELAGDGITGLLRQVFEAHSFRQILADQTVGVLIRSSLPGVVRGGEIEADITRRLHFAVGMELAAVV